jgi:hypothetical protein
MFKDYWSHLLHLHNSGITDINYIDSLIGVTVSMVTANLLIELNFQISNEKTFKPNSKITCLGIVIDCEARCLYTPEAKLFKIIKT